METTTTSQPPSFALIACAPGAIQGSHSERAGAALPDLAGHELTAPARGRRTCAARPAYRFAWG